MPEKNDYIVFRTLKEESSGRVYYNDIVSLQGMIRGLYDWSDGREILGRLESGHVLDVFVAQLTWDEVEEIRDGKATPPGTVKRLRDAGMGHLV